MDYLIKPTQENRILKIFQDNPNRWISGQYFLRDMMLSQYHARIWGLQKKGYKIEASEHTDDYGFKFYKYIPEEVLVKKEIERLDEQISASLF
jgi:hypothetical protein